MDRRKSPAYIGFPRVSGDEPNPRDGPNGPSPFSPRERG